MARKGNESVQKLLVLANRVLFYATAATVVMTLSVTVLYTLPGGYFGDSSESMAAPAPTCTPNGILTSLWNFLESCIKFASSSLGVARLATTWHFFFLVRCNLIAFTLSACVFYICIISDGLTDVGRLEHRLDICKYAMMLAVPLISASVYGFAFRMVAFSVIREAIIICAVALVGILTILAAYRQFLPPTRPTPVEV